MGGQQNLSAGVTVQQREVAIQEACYRSVTDKMDSERSQVILKWMELVTRWDAIVGVLGRQSSVRNFSHYSLLTP